jgi:hypothetical protein
VGLGIDRVFYVGSYMRRKRWEGQARLVIILSSGKSRGSIVGVFGRHSSCPGEDILFCFVLVGHITFLLGAFSTLPET